MSGRSIILYKRMKLTPEIIKKIEEAFEHTKMNGDVNWQDGDEIDAVSYTHLTLPTKRIV